MPRYIDIDILAKIVFDKWQECDELKQIIPAMRNAIMCASTTDMVDKGRYDRLVENSLIISKALNEYQTADFVQVVRCRDCQYWKKETEPIGIECEPGEDAHYCDMDGMITRTADFCSYGEREKPAEPEKK